MISFDTLFLCVGALLSVGGFVATGALTDEGDDVYFPVFGSLLLVFLWPIAIAAGSAYGLFAAGRRLRLRAARREEQRRIREAEEHRLLAEAGLE